MLHEFITSYRDPIIARTREKLTDRPWPLASTSELEHGVPLFLTQLSETLRLEMTPTPFPEKALGDSATKHGRELRTRGGGIPEALEDPFKPFAERRQRDRTVSASDSRSLARRSACRGGNLLPQPDAGVVSCWFFVGLARARCCLTNVVFTREGDAP